MPILNFDESTSTFAFAEERGIAALTAQIERNLFGDAGYHVTKGFVDRSVADRMREFYAVHNASTFRSERSPLFAFHGQSLIVYYPKSPYQNPDFIMSAYHQLSLLRNRVYQNQDFYIKYCKAFHLDPTQHEQVYQHQINHTWARLSWYKDHDGQCAHLDNVGEIAAFLILSQKGIHWQKGGLYLYDSDGNRTVEVDDHCEVGDLLWLDQHKVIHGVEPIVGANPGRMLFYVPIIPYGYMKPWFTFQGYPREIHFSKTRVSPWERTQAYLQNTWNNLTGKTSVHYSRSHFVHTSLHLPPARPTAPSTTSPRTGDLRVRDADRGQDQVARV